MRSQKHRKTSKEQHASLDLVNVNVKHFKQEMLETDHLWAKIMQMNYNTFGMEVGKTEEKSSYIQFPDGVVQVLSVCYTVIV